MRMCAAAFVVDPYESDGKDHMGGGTYVSRGYK